MGHDHHFLSRLDRFATPEVELALSLYRDHHLVRQVLNEAKIPEAANRVAISLDDPKEGPFIVVARDGGFVTCLGRGMSTGRLPIITRKQLDAIAQNVNLLRERLKLAVSLTGGDVYKLFERVLKAGPRISREEVTALLAIQPLIWPELAVAMVDIDLELIKTRTLFRNMRKPKPLHRKLLYATWQLLWAYTHIVLLVGKNGRTFLKVLGEDGTKYWAHFMPKVIKYSIFSLWARGVWTTARLGKYLLGASKKTFAEGLSLPDVYAGVLGLSAIGHGNARLRAEARKALFPQPMEGDGTVVKACNNLRRIFASVTERTFENPENSEEIALLWGRISAVVCLQGSPVYRFKEPEDVPDDIARDFACWYWGATGGEVEAMKWLLVMVPWIVRQPLESFFLPSELLRHVAFPPPEEWAHDVLLRPWKAGFVDAPRPIRVPKTPGRNDPCSCGSGIKYKRCCGSLAAGAGGR